MKQESDIHQMIGGLRLKRRFRKMNHDKLARLFERTELDVPESWLSGAVDLQRLRDSAISYVPPKRNSAGYIPKPVRWAAVTAVAAALIFFVVYPFAFSMMTALAPHAAYPRCQGDQGRA